MADGLFYPCLCLCFGFTQMTRTTPSRWITLHLSQIFLTDARTFISFSQFARNPAARRIVRRQFHLDPVARNQPDKIPFHRAHQVGQNLLLRPQDHLEDGTGPLLDHSGLDLYGLVRTHGPFSVTAMQCSKCADLDPSFVTPVHRSLRTTAS